jgi:type II restriction enzyme
LVGCNIDIIKVPESGKVFIVKNSKKIEREKVYLKLKNTDFFKIQKFKNWMLDILKCVEEIKKQSFTLDKLHAFENKLKIKYPNNNHIKDKIRQQLQLRFLRDGGLIEFNGRGNYKKIEI